MKKLRHFLHGGLAMVLVSLAVAPAGATTLIREDLAHLVAGNATVLVVVLGLLAPPMWGQQATLPNPDLLPFLRSLSPASASTVQVSTQDGQQKTFCHASCAGDGTDLDVTCNGDCNAQDRSCSIGKRGFVECEGKVQYCAGPCPTCQVFTYCLTVGAVKCQGWTCTAYPGCAVQCDNATYYCPLPTDPSQEACM